VTRAPIVRLLGLFAPDRRAIALASLLQFGTMAAGVALMATSAWLISRAAERPSIAALSLAVVGVRAFGIGRGVLRYLERLVAHDVTLRLLTRMRTWVYGTLEPLSPARLVERRSGELAGRVVADVDALEHVYVRLLGPVLAAVMLAAFVAVLLAPRGAMLALVTVTGVLGGGTVASWVAWGAGQRAGARVVTLRGELDALVVDGVQGMPELVTFGRAADHARTLETTGAALAQAQVRASGSASLGGVLVGLSADLTAAVVLALGIVAVSGGELDGVQLAVVTLVALAAFEAVAPLPAAWQALGGAREAARRMFELADTPAAVLDPPAPLPAPAGCTWHVRQLSFTYPGATSPALEDVSIALEPGRLVAVVGPSGSGKSTLVSLLLRFWDVPAGTLVVDGVDVQQVAPDELRRRMAVVPQRTHLFTGTVAENLRLARPDAGDEALEAALEAAGMSGVVSRLPQGLHSWVGEQGIALSGGERQRLALARALLTGAPLLVLDEPTANLDAITEREVVASVRAAAGSAAVLLVTHRLVGLSMADEIVVLAGGRVTERGSWRELSAGDGWFGRTLQLQAASIDDLVQRAARGSDGPPAVS
jgi:ATP-binding cassette, subfamily C, bacterial CydC